mgnify:CR=1 FL=1
MIKMRNMSSDEKYDRIFTTAMHVVKTHSNFQRTNLTPESILNDHVEALPYADAQEPHLDTGDLFYVYAANLFNSGLVGPEPATFGELIRGAIAHNRDANLDIPQLAKQCLTVLDVTGLKLTRKTHDKWISKIKAAANGRCNDHPDSSGRYRKTNAFKALESVVAFNQLLIKSGNSASKLSTEWGSIAQDLCSTKINPLRRLESYCLLIKTLIDLPLLKVALAANFIKDSQMRNKDNPFVRYMTKPDMHIVRLTAGLAGLVPSYVQIRNNIEVEELVESLIRDPGSGRTIFTEDIYQDYLPVQRVVQGAGLPKEYTSGLCAVYEIYKFAEESRKSPLTLDRLLYLIGSGRISFEKEIWVGKRTDKIARYMMLFE